MLRRSLALTLLPLLGACLAGRPDEALWQRAFDTTGAGALSGVWGSAPDDVWVVGGTPAGGELYHFDGAAWTAHDLPDGVPLLVWVHGFGPDDVWAVGLQGAVVHFDGAAWTRLDAGTTADLWGVFGLRPDELWLVGGDVVNGPPTLLRYDGAAFTPYELPASENSRGAGSLFKVWGTGESLYAVGQRGLVLAKHGDQPWREQLTGAEVDLISLWGSGPDELVLVGGRGVGRITTWDGTDWTTSPPLSVPGINAVHVDNSGRAYLGGVYGWVGTYEPGAASPTEEPSVTTDDVHALWGDGEGRVYGVGGRFAEPFRGVAVVRTEPDGG